MGSWQSKSRQNDGRFSYRANPLFVLDADMVTKPPPNLDNSAASH